MRALRVKGWAARFENSSSKDIKYANWVPMPNAMDSDDYALIMDHDDGMLHFAGWNMIVMIASRGRGDRRGLLVKPDGQPHDALSLARVARVGREDRHVMQALVERLVEEMGWLEWVEIEEGAGIPHQSSEASQSSPAIREHAPVIPERVPGIPEHTPVIRDRTSRIGQRGPGKPGTVPEFQASRAHEGTGNKELGTKAAAAVVVEGIEPPLPPTITPDEELVILELLHRATRAEQHLPQGSNLRNIRLAIQGATPAEVHAVIDQAMARRKRDDPPRSYKFWPPLLLEELAALRTAQVPEPQRPRASAVACLACSDSGVVGGLAGDVTLANIKQAIAAGGRWCDCGREVFWRDFDQECYVDGFADRQVAS